MENKKISSDKFKNQARHKNVKNINITAAELSQQDFDELINIIGKATDKTTFLSFMPNLRENETIEENISEKPIKESRFINSFNVNFCFSAILIYLHVGHPSPRK